MSTKRMTDDRYDAVTGILIAHCDHLAEDLQRSSEMQRVLRELCITVASILEVGGLEDK